MNDTNDAIELKRALRCVERYVEAHGDTHPLWALAMALGTVAATLVVQIAEDAGKDCQEDKRTYLASLANVFDLIIKTSSANESLH